MVPVEYHEFIDLFSEKAAEKLPPHRPYGHSIPLIEGKTPPTDPCMACPVSNWKHGRNT